MVQQDNTLEHPLGNGDGAHPSRWRLVAWGGAALALLTPWIAGWPWTASDFVFAGVLFGGALGAFEAVMRTTRHPVHRAGVGLAVAATFLLIWGNAALDVTDSVADVGYFGVALVGIVGVTVALFRPAGGAVAMVVAALGMGAVSGFALASGLVPNPTASAFEVTRITGFYAALYAGAAWLLREAARREGGRSAA